MSRRRQRVLAIAGLFVVVLAVLFIAVSAHPAGGAADVSDRAPSVEPEHPSEGRPLVIPLDGPYVVAVQPGVREVDINLAVTEHLVPLLETEGWQVLVVPATVPPGLRADAFLSIHADWGADPERAGWKLAAPWRPSPASNHLAAALRDSFLAEPILHEDVDGITVGMRGYFGFAAHRFDHASSPYTPAVLVELGFLTNDRERRRMVEEPAYYATILHRGLVAYFAQFDRSDTDRLVPRRLGMMMTDDQGAVARRIADSAGAVLRRLSPGEVVRVVDEQNGWYEVRIRTPALTGWVHGDELVQLGRPASLQ